MRKEYEAPKAEKMEFNYSETVVASTPKACDWYMTLTQGYEGCTEVGPIKQWHPDVG